MIQPYVDSIESRGETGVIFVGGQFSHAIGKGAMLGGERKAEADGLYIEETIVAREPSADELSLARRTIDAAPGGPDGLTYARIDLVPDADGRPLIMELELTEPSLFMKTTPGSRSDSRTRSSPRLSALEGRGHNERPGARPSAAARPQQEGLS